MALSLTVTKFFPGFHSGFLRDKNTPATLMDAYEPLLPLRIILPGLGKVARILKEPVSVLIKPPVVSMRPFSENSTPLARISETGGMVESRSFAVAPFAFFENWRTCFSFIEK